MVPPRLRIDSEIIRVGRTTHQLDSAPRSKGGAQSIPEVGHLRGHDWQRARLDTAGQPEGPAPVCPAANRAAAAAFNAANSTSSCAEPMCSIEREPFRQDHTICTATAPDEVFTVRTYAIGSQGRGVRSADPFPHPPYLCWGPP